jgi:hypothetical protein
MRGLRLNLCCSGQEQLLGFYEHDNERSGFPINVVDFLTGVRRRTLLSEVQVLSENVGFPLSSIIPPMRLTHFVYHRCCVI